MQDWTKEEAYQALPSIIHFRLEEFINKKISDSRMILALPEGKRYLLWLYPTRKKQIWFSLPTQFATPVAAQELVKGRETKIEDLEWNTQEDQFLYVIVFPFIGQTKQGIALLDVLTPQYQDLSFLQKIRKLFPLLQEASHPSHSRLLGLPSMYEQFSEALKKAETLPYKVVSFKFCNKSPNFYWMKYFRPGKKYQGLVQENQYNTPQYNHTINATKVFWVEKQTQPDIYLLIDLGEYCLVNDLKTSQWLNQLYSQAGERKQLHCQWVGEVKKWRPVMGP